MSFAQLKKASQSLETLQSAVQEEKKKNDYSDDRFWSPQLDDDGSASAEIRFLPAPEGEKLPWVKKFSYGFKHQGKWFIEDSPTTIGKPDPVSEYNTKVWNDTTRDQKEREDDSRSRKRTLSYISNILVINDPANPDNNGKVFLYRYGKKIHDKIIDCIEPEFKDQQAFNPTDFWTGANFKLRIVKVAGFNNYDKSQFMQPTELLDGNDKELKKVYDSLYSLEDLISEDKFKSYDELLVKFNRVMGFGADIPYTGGKPIDVKPAKNQVNQEIANPEEDEDDDSEDDVLAQLKKLAESSEEETE